MPKKRGRGRPKGSLNRGAGIGSQMIRELTAYRQNLLRNISSMQQQADALSQALGAMGVAAAAAPAARRGRPPGSGKARGDDGRKRARKGSLKACLVQVLRQSSSPVAVKDMITGVRRVGYRTQSKSLGNQISMALRVMPEVKKVAHGLYSLAG